MGEEKQNYSWGYGSCLYPHSTSVADWSHISCKLNWQKSSYNVLIYYSHVVVDISIIKQFWNEIAREISTNIIRINNRIIIPSSNLNWRYALIIFEYSYPYKLYIVIMKHKLRSYINYICNEITWQTTFQLKINYWHHFRLQKNTYIAAVEKQHKCI